MMLCFLDSVMGGASFHEVSDTRSKSGTPFQVSTGCAHVRSLRSAEQTQHAVKSAMVAFWSITMNDVGGSASTCSCPRPAGEIGGKRTTKRQKGCAGATCADQPGRKNMAHRFIW